MAIVTEIIKKCREKDIYVVSFDNGQKFNVFDEFIILYHISVNSQIDDEVISEIKYKSDEKIAQNFALKTLSRGLKTRKELESKLKQKNIEHVIIDKVINIMIDYGYINDEIYAKQYFCINKNIKGKRRIEQELEQKGVDKEIINNLFENQDENELQRVVNVIAEKYMRNKDSSYKNKSKLYNHLLSKGFDYSQINRAMNNFKWANDINIYDE